MKKHVVSFLPVCALSLILVGCASTSHHRTVWEYKILQVVQRESVSDAEKQLNDLARQGWVLVSESTTELGLPRHTFVLKRPVQQ